MGFDCGVRGKRIVLLISRRSYAAGTSERFGRALIDVGWRLAVSAARRLCGSRWFEPERFLRFSVSFIFGPGAADVRLAAKTAPKSAFGVPLSVSFEEGVGEDTAISRTVLTAATGFSRVRSAGDFAEALLPFGSDTRWDTCRIAVVDPARNRLAGSLGRNMDDYDPERTLLPALAPAELVPEIAAELRMNPPDGSEELMWRKPDAPPAEPVPWYWDSASPESLGIPVFKEERPL